MANPSEEETSTSITELLEKLEAEGKLSAKQRVSKISNVVEKVCQEAYKNGLDHQSLDQLLDIITLPSRIEQGSLATLIKNLYPASKIVDFVVIKVVGSLGHGRGKPSLTVQGLLLRWLVMVYDVLESQKILAQLYSVLFNLLDTVAIRPQLCHMLALITRRKHVRPYRIQVLMELMRRAGNEPPLVGLLRVYKDYYPDVIVGDTSGRASVFTHPSQEWRQRLQAIQELGSQRAQNQLSTGKQAFRVTRNSASVIRRTQSSILPEVHTSHAHESSVTLEEIESVQDFVQNLEKIEPPNQLVAAIGDPLLQKFLQLRSSEAGMKRIDDWLMAFFEDQLENPHSAEAKILQMLTAVLEYTRHTKALPFGCLTYLKAMLPTWNGTTGREVILNLLAYVPLGPFEDLYTSTFQPLEEAILGDGTEISASHLSLLTFYRALISRWSTNLLASPKVPLISATAFTKLTTHAYLLCLTLLTTSPSLTTHSAILAVLETFASLHTISTLHTSIRITIPPASLMYILVFTSSLSTLSRLCAILALYKRAFEAHAQKTHAHGYQKAYLNTFNGYLMDVCNCLWRMKALTTQDPNALGCLVSSPVAAALTRYATTLDREVLMSVMFGLPHNVVTAALAETWLREVEDEREGVERRHRGPVTARSLDTLGKDGGVKLQWTEYRISILKYLERQGVSGVGDLMRTTMKVVMDAA